MKRLLSILSLIAFISTLSLSVFAHSGRTDGNGGHYDDNGNYHYHHGFPAHNHPNGVCPYKQNTIENDNEQNTGIKILFWIIVIISAIYFVSYIVLGRGKDKNELLDILWYFSGLLVAICIIALFNL